MLGIVVPVMKNFKGLAVFLESVGNVEHRLYIGNNWVTNYGVSHQWNKGIKAAIEDGCDRILVSNDDIVLGKDAIRNMSARLDDEDVVVATGYDYRDSVSAEDVKDLFIKSNDEDDCPEFCCFMIRPDTIDKIGWFDENFRPAYFEDNDYHYRVKLSGYKSLRLYNSPIVHIGSVTQNMDGRDTVCVPEQFRQNRLYYELKWGGWPGSERFTTPFNKEAK